MRAKNEDLCDFLDVQFSQEFAAIEVNRANGGESQNETQPC
jgi:hypothetical protein